MSLAQILIRSGWPAVSSVTSGSARRASASSIGSPTWRWSTLTPSGAGDELDDLAGVERAIDRFERAGAGAPMLDDGVGDLAQGAADGVDARQVALRRAARPRPAPRTRSAPSVWITPRSTNQVEGVVERRELLGGETIVGVVGVQEVEGVVEIDVVRMTRGPRRGAWMFIISITTICLLTGYAQEGTLDQ